MSIFGDDLTISLGDWYYVNIIMCAIHYTTAGLWVPLGLKIDLTINDSQEARNVYVMFILVHIHVEGKISSILQFCGFYIFRALDES